MEDVSKDTFNKSGISKILGLSSTLLVVVGVLGLLSLNTYYKGFGNFSVYRYLDWSEVLLTAFGSDFYVSFVFIFLVLTPIYLHFYVEEERSYSLSVEDISFIFRVYLLIIICLAIIIILSTFEYFKDITLWFLAALSLLTTMFVAYSILSKKKNPPKWFDNIRKIFLIEFFRLLVILLFPSVFIYFKSLVNAKAVNYFNTYKGSVIFTDKEAFVSNDTLYYIGKIKNYTFFYNRKQDNVTVIPENSIKKSIIKVSSPF